MPRGGGLGASRDLAGPRGSSLGRHRAASNRMAQSQSTLEISLDPRGALKDRPGGSLGPSCRPFGSSWVPLGCFLPCLEGLLGCPVPREA
eukprot:687590-Pyramimonas_sp.AAC.1